MSKRLPTILFLHAGVYENDRAAHADYFPELNQLRKSKDIDVVEANILRNGFDDLFKAHNITLVATRQLRDWQERHSEFFGPLAKIQDLANRNGAVLANDTSVWSWNYNKGLYLKGLEANDIPIVKTTVFRPEQVLTLNFDQILLDNPSGLVTKPGAGARAAGVHFIMPVRKGKYLLRQPQELSKGPVQERTLDTEEVKDWFASYAAGYGNIGVLLQENIKQKHEVSVIFIQGQKPYAVLRTTGENTWIAHENYGGKNIPLSEVAPEILSFAKATIVAMPDNVKNAAFHRIDILVSPDRLRLLEVEEGSARLFVKEKREFELYGALATLALEQNHSRQRALATPSAWLEGASSDPVLPIRAREIYMGLDRIAKSAAGIVTGRKANSTQSDYPPAAARTFTDSGIRRNLAGSVSKFAIP